MTGTYDDEKHEYWYGDEPFISVTQVLREAGIIEHIFADEHARWMGEARHRAIELYAKNTLDEGTVAPEIRPGLDAYINFVRDTGFRMTASEEKQFNPLLKLACKPDLVGIFPDGAEAIVEVKSGGLADWVKLQTAGQDLCMGAARSRRRFGLSLAGGKPTVKLYNDPDDYTIFQSALNVALWKRKRQNRREP